MPVIAFAKRDGERSAARVRKPVPEVSGLVVDVYTNAAIKGAKVRIEDTKARTSGTTSAPTTTARSRSSARRLSRSRPE